MIRWRPWLALALAAIVAGVGCKSSSSSASLTIAPLTTTVLINNTAQFTPTLTGSTATIIWQVNSVAGGDIATNGSISTNGLYTAPPTVPSNPKVTITALLSGTSTTATATLTIQSGVQISINPTTLTIGTNESFPFVATVTGVPPNEITSTCNSVAPSSSLPPCNAVTWKLVGAGAIGATSGVYTAPAPGFTSATAVVVATSVFDSNAAASTSITLVNATDPTIVSIGPNTGSRGAVFQDIYLSGTNFISTTNVFINGVQVPVGDVQVSSVTCATLVTINTSGTSVPIPPCTAASLTAGSTVLAVHVPDLFLATSLVLPSTNAVSLNFTVARQNSSAPRTCPNPSQCQLILSPVRPAIVGATPDSIQQGVGSAFNLTVNGGYYGTGLNPVVTAQFGGQPIFPAISGVNPDRQMNIAVLGSAASSPGLYQLGVASDTPGLPQAFANLAVQPKYNISPSAIATLPVGTTPAAVAVNTATGIAVVANQASNDVYLIDLTVPTPVVVAKICTGAVTGSAGTTEPCTAAGTPTGVAVDNLRNIALVTNSANNTIAVVDLNLKKVTYILNPALVTNNTSIPQFPVSVGINPATGRAVVAYRGAAFGLLLDTSNLNSATLAPATCTTTVPTTTPIEPQCIVGMTNISTGGLPRISVSPKLNWALVSPGGLGSLSIVNLSQQSSNTITGATRSNGSVTVVTSTTHTLQVGESVLISGFTGASDSTFNGLNTVISVLSDTSFTYTQSTTLANATATSTGTVSYGVPVATDAVSLTTTGVAINDQTSKALLADAGSSLTPAAIFSMVDQSSVTLASGIFPQLGTIGAAFNPLNNIAVTINQTNKTGYVIDPVTPTVLTTFPVGNDPWDVAIDPGTDYAVVINQQDNTASIVPLGTLRAGPEVLQVSPADIFVPSTLTTTVVPPVFPNNVVTVIGSGFSSSSMIRMDGTALTTTFNAAFPRTLTATVLPAMLGGPHLYKVDVIDTGVLSNAASLSVIQSVSVSGFGCMTPVPAGVAIDGPNNVAVVTDSNCNEAYLIHMNTGLGQIVSVGTTPLGVAVVPQGGLAVVANTGSNNISLVDDLNADVTATISTENGPTGVAIDPVLNQIAITAAGSNDVDVLSTTSTNGATFTPTGVQQGPGPVAIDPINHIVAVGNETGNSVTLFALVAGSSFATQTIGVSFPTGIVFDPVKSNFLVASSLNNQIELINSLTALPVPVSVGINPTAIAYNFASSTLVTANGIGGNMTIVDMIEQRVRGVFPLTSSGQFSIAIDPQTNLLVVADQLNARILLVPLP